MNLLAVMLAPTIANLTASMVASGSVFGQFHHHETSFTSECAGHTWIIVKIVSVAFMVVVMVMTISDSFV